MCEKRSLSKQILECESKKDLNSIIEIYHGSDHKIEKHLYGACTSRKRY